MKTEIRKKGFPLIGVVFLALGLLKFLRGDDWVAWALLGLVFGGLAAFGRTKASDG